MVSHRPATIVTAAVVTMVMASVAALVALWDLAATGVAFPESGTNVYYVVVALILVPAALALLAGRRWPRAVLVTAHLLVLLSMVTLIPLLSWMAVVTAALSVLVVCCIASPSARAFVGANRRPAFLED